MGFHSGARSIRKYGIREDMDLFPPIVGWRAHWRRLFMYGREEKWFRASLAANGSDVFAGTSDGLLHTTNGGMTWAWGDCGMTLGGGERMEPMKTVETVKTTPSTKPGIVMQVYVQRIIPPVPASRRRVVRRPLKVVQAVAFAGRKLIAGTTGGEVFVSTDDRGTHWEMVNDRLRDSVIIRLMISGGYLYCGSWDYGVWKRRISDIVASAGRESHLTGKTEIDRKKE